MFLRKLFSATLLPALVLSSMAIVFAQLGTAGISGQVLDRVQQFRAARRLQLGPVEQWPYVNTRRLRHLL